jgi:hypothetical protein
MFWRFSYSSSQIQTLLEKEVSTTTVDWEPTKTKIKTKIFQDVTLQEIISEDDVLQECKSNNEKLIDL